MPSFREAGLKEIRENPDLFDAIVEWEKTKELRKLTYRKRLDITINEELLKKFKKYCEEKGLVMSRVLEKHIKEELS